MTTNRTDGKSFDIRSLRRLLTVQVLFALDGTADAALAVRRLNETDDLIGLHPEDAGIDANLDALLPHVGAEDRNAAIDIATRLWQRRDEVDGLIVPALKGWRLERLEGVDRAILRLCIFEARVERTVNDAVAASEAVELAKIMSGDESAHFLNGVIGSIMRQQS